MADIFISYANEDRSTAARVAALLEAVGWRVWWDRRIPAGRSWRTVLAEALVDTRCMVVLWSDHSVESPWVAEEAEEARRLQKALVPVLIGRVEPPIGFRTIQAADLSRWDGSADHPAAAQLIADLKALIGAPDQRAAAPTPEVPSPPRSEAGRFISRAYPTSGIIAALLVLGAAVVAAVWHNWPRDRSEISAGPQQQTQVEIVEPPRLTGLSVDGRRKDLEPSETLQLAATGKYSDGSAGTMTGGIQWSSSDSRVASVDGRGEVKALSAGTATITARAGDRSAEWLIRVGRARPVAKAEPSLVRLTIDAGRQELVQREAIVLRAVGKYSDDSEKPLDSGIEWRTSDRTVASVNADGRLMALRPGKVEVVARADRVTSAPVSFNVKEAERVSPPGRTEPVVKSDTRAQKATAMIAAYIRRAESLREQGDYAAALAQLEKARAVAGASEEIARQIEQTRRACNAEKLLGVDVKC